MQKLTDKQQWYCSGVLQQAEMMVGIGKKVARDALDYPTRKVKRKGF
jgi:hypothetical protein